MNKKQIITCEVIDLTDKGQGVVKHEDIIGFVSKALPDELVTLRVDKIKKTYFLGSLVSIDRPSPLRTEPFCKHFDMCGGCQLQHLDYTHHAATKKAQWLSLYKKMIGTECPCIPDTVFPTKDTYRRKARLSCRWIEKKNKVCVGFREINSRYVLDGQYCPLLSSDQDLFAKLSPLLTSLSIKQSVPQVEYIADQYATHLIFRVLTTPSINDCKKLQDFCEKNGYKGYLQTTGKYLLIELNQGSSQDIYSKITQQQFTSVTCHYQINQLDFIASPNDFVQVNALVNEKIIDLVCSWVNDIQPKTLLDLFCGIGNFSLPIARLGVKVLGLEISESMVDKASENARTNKLKASFEMTDLTTLEPGKWPHGTFDCLIIDPPRFGAKEVVAAICDINPSTIIYIACDPATALRDLNELICHGYALDQVALFDMFAQTTHIETALKIIKKDI